MYVLHHFENYNIKEVNRMPWREKLKNNISTVEQLKKHIDLSTKERNKIQKIIEKHPMSISQYYMSLIQEKGSYDHDPIKRMIVPQIEELNLEGSYDPSGEEQNTKMPGLQHKYVQTALILATNRCAAYCRHCFRKRLVGLPSEEILRRLNDAIRYIDKHKEINNVLISGGDPFILPTGVIKKLLEKLSVIDHLNFIRFGTRVPVVFPERILEDIEFVDILKENSHKKRRIYVVTQFNHPREITEKSTEAVSRLIESGIIVNNQTVLLKGVNDDSEILSELLNKLVSIGANPYYVFQCRPVKRVKYRFQVPLYRGYFIVEEAKKGLNGHSKRFRYVMSHRTGKIEILGIIDDSFIFKYHQAKNPKNLGRIFTRRVSKTAGWLDDLDSR